MRPLWPPPPIPAGTKARSGNEALVKGNGSEPPPWIRTRPKERLNQYSARPVSSLVTSGPKGETLPSVAGVLKPRTTNLRVPPAQDAKWSNGDPVTAADFTSSPFQRAGGSPEDGVSATPGTWRSDHSQRYRHHWWQRTSRHLGVKAGDDYTFESPAGEGGCLTSSACSPTTTTYPVPEEGGREVW